jgi:thiosulfate/3-mercaptopyruvate sulfurtransferase
MRKFVPALLLIAALSIAQPPPPREADLVKPAEFAPQMKDALILQVGFDVLYRAAHIPGSDYAGPGSKPEGLELLKKSVAGQPHDRAIVLYCGCCPWDKCPNIRPALEALHEMGFTHVRAVVIPENFKTDWIDKGYPTEKRVQ